MRTFILPPEQPFNAVPCHTVPPPPATEHSKVTWFPRHTHEVIILNASLSAVPACRKYYRLNDPEKIHAKSLITLTCVQ